MQNLFLSDDLTEELKLEIELLSDKLCIFSDSSKADYWVGVQTTDGVTWKWINGYVIDRLEYFQFWYPTQPNDRGSVICARMSVYAADFYHRLADVGCHYLYLPACHHY